VEKKENNKLDKKAKKEKILNGERLEKGDFMAIMIAAFTTIFPFAIVIIIIFFLFAKLYFRF
jgi:hypothetical protein